MKNLQIVKNLTIILILIGLAGCQSSVSKPPMMQSDNVHPGIAQFGQLVGDWHIKQQVRQEDGSWQSIDDADWNFRYILGGYAIQDEWIQPPLSTVLKQGERRQFGTNVRIYDDKANKWKIIWASNDNSNFTSYIATSNDQGELIMIGEDLERPGLTQKITYFQITKDSWKWKMEFSNDEKNWTEVARIQATARKSMGSK